MTPKREAYLKNISFGERVCRHCIRVMKDKLKREKSHLNENKVRPTLSGYDIAMTYKRIKAYKKRLTFYKRELRIGTDPNMVIRNG